MAPAAIAQTPTSPPEPIVLERLISERSRLTQELADFQASAARLRETANAEAAVIQEVGALGRAEIDAMTAWATDGCVGPEPTPDQKQRKALAEKLAAAQAAAAAAKGAGRDIDQKIADVSNHLRTINAQIELAAFDAVEAEHAAVMAQYQANCEKGRKLASRIHGLANFYGDKGRALFDRGDQDGATAYLRRSSALTGMKLPSPGVSRADVEAAAAEWGRRIDALRRGA
jgi:hypothetical protein